MRQGHDRDRYILLDYLKGLSGITFVASVVIILYAHFHGSGVPFSDQFLNFVLVKANQDFSGFITYITLIRPIIP